MRPYALSYEAEPTTVVTFMLTGDDLSPKDITDALNIAPSEVWTKGQPIRMPSGRSFGQYHTNGWIVNPPCSPSVPFEEQLDRLLQLLEELPAVLHEFVKRFDGSIFVGYSSGLRRFGFDLDHQTNVRLCGLGLSIGFDIYSIQDTHVKDNE